MNRTGVVSLTYWPDGRWVRGDSDWIGPNSLMLGLPGSAPVHLGRTGLATAVEETFATDEGGPITKKEEELFLPQAVSGSVAARRRIIDAYTELATM
jgi:hypothetical protein